MLGHFRMNINEAVNSLLDVAFAVFPEESHQTPNLEMNSQRLKVALEDMLQARGVSLDTKMNEASCPQTRCKVYVIFLSHFMMSHIYQCSLCGNLGQCQPPSPLPYIFVSRTYPQSNHRRSHLCNYIRFLSFFTSENRATADRTKLCRRPVRCK